jgi:hypothetical protein
MSRIHLFVLLYAVSGLSLSAWKGDYYNSSGTVNQLDVSPPSVVNNQSEVIIVSEIDTQQNYPQVAFNSKHNEYLVVWEQSGSADSGIYGQRISHDGKKVGPSPIAIAVGPKRRSSPAVAYDPGNDHYLVVWTHDHDGSGVNNDISGRIIPWQKTDPTLQEFKISNLPDYQTIPKVVYNSTKKEFLILWLHYQSDVLKDIMAARMQADGSIFTQKDKKILDPVSNLLPNYDVEFNPARNEYLVTWTKHSIINASDVYMTRLRWDCQVLGIKENLVVSTTDSESSPSAAAWETADGYNGYLLVWWASNMSGNNKFIGKFYSGGLVAYAGTITILESKNEVGSPYLISNFWRDQMLVVWRYRMNATENHGIRGRFVSPNRSTSPAFEIAPPSPISGKTKGGIALSSAAGGRSNFLATWDHLRYSMRYDDIHARLVAMPTIHLPLVLKR